MGKNQDEKLGFDFFGDMKRGILDKNSIFQQNLQDLTVSVLLEFGSFWLNLNYFYVFKKSFEKHIL